MIPARFDDEVPEFTAVATIPTIAKETPIHSYTPKNYEYNAVNPKCYFFTQVSGNYTFSIPKADDIAAPWVGPSAKFNWTRATMSNFGT